MVANGGIEPTLIDLVRKTHTRKDGTFADGRAKKIVEDVEAAVTHSEWLGGEGSAATTPSPQQLDKLFIEVNGL